MSKARIDRLGDRLRAGNPGEDDLRELARYRATFEPAYHTVLKGVRGILRLVPTGRPAKSTRSIIDKLNRESIRLSQIQDVAGLRVVVPDVDIQEDVMRELSRLYPDASMVDRRVHRSHGYRAVHVIARQGGLPVEVQVRTTLQHLWAEASEKLADLFGPELKYGGGPPPIVDYLHRKSEEIAWAEEDGESDPEVKHELDQLLKLIPRVRRD